MKTRTHSKISKWLGLLTGGICALAQAGAAVVVDWGGSPDYVTSNAPINPAAFSYVTEGSSKTAVYVYNTVTAGTPTTGGYAAPAGKTGNFYTGSYITALDTTSNRAWTYRSVEDGGATDDYIYFRRGGNSDTGYSGMSFTSFLKADFLNGGSTTTLDLGSGSSLSMTINASLGSEFRFAVLDNGQWYVGETSYASNGVKVLDGSSLAGESWGAWNPTGGANSRLGALPGDYTVSTPTFSDLAGFGVVVSYSAAVNSTTASGLSAFQVTAVPEPTVTGLAMLGLILGLRRRKRTAR